MKIAANAAASVAIRCAPSAHIVDANFFRGRRVIVVGPADTAHEYLDGAGIDRFDIVVRINSSLRLVPMHAAKIGSRTDVLAHSLYEGGSRGTGPIEPALLAAQSTKLILCPLPNPDQWVSYFRIRRRFRRLDWSPFCTKPVQIRVTPPSRYHQLRRLLGGMAPTTGLATVDYLLGALCAELHITGFTFFTTAYSRGYKPGVDDASAARAWSSASKHDASRECELMSRLVEVARSAGGDVRLDAPLESLLRECGSRGRQP